MSAPAGDLTGDDVAKLAERSFVGALLHQLRDDDTARALNWVRPDDLADPQLAAVLGAMQSLHARGTRPDIALIVPEMLALGTVSRAQAPLANVLLVDLMTECPIPASWAHYAATITAASARREIRKTCTRVLQAADGPDLVAAVRLMSQGLGCVAEAVNRAVGGRS